MSQRGMTCLIGFVLTMSLAGCGEAKPRAADEQRDKVIIRWRGMESGYEGETKKSENGSIENTSAREKP